MRRKSLLWAYQRAQLKKTSYQKAGGGKGENFWIELSVSGVSDRRKVSEISLLHSKTRKRLFNFAMAVSSVSSTLIPSLTIPNSPSPKPKFNLLSPSSPISFNPLKLSNNTLKLSLSPTKVFAAPEALEETPEVGGSEVPGSSSVSAEADKTAPKQKIRIKLRSYWVPLIEDSCKQIMDAARTTNAKTMGPVPLPTKKRIYCVLKSPHVHKDARFHFEIRTHQRLIDILYPTAQTIDSLMQLDLPAGVDVEVKL